MRSLLAGLVLILASAAWAIDPDCADATGEPPVYQGCQLKVGSITSTLTFCTPQFDTDGDPIPEVGALESCSVSLNGGPEQINTVGAPGVTTSFTVIGKYPGHTITAWCTNTEGLADTERSELAARLQDPWGATQEELALAAEIIEADGFELEQLDVIQALCDAVEGGEPAQ
jgi:hypothetical protein